MLLVWPAIEIANGPWSRYAPPQSPAPLPARTTSAFQTVASLCRQRPIIRQTPLGLPRRLRALWSPPQKPRCPQRLAPPAAGSHFFQPTSFWRSPLLFLGGRPARRSPQLERPSEQTWRQAAPISRRLNESLPSPCGAGHQFCPSAPLPLTHPAAANRYTDWCGGAKPALSNAR